MSGLFCCLSLNILLGYSFLYILFFYVSVFGSQCGRGLLLPVLWYKQCSSACSSSVELRKSWVFKDWWLESRQIGDGLGNRLSRNLNGPNTACQGPWFWSTESTPVLNWWFSMRISRSKGRIRPNSYKHCSILSGVHFLIEMCSPHFVCHPSPWYPVGTFWVSWWKKNPGWFTLGGGWYGGWQLAVSDPTFHALQP